MQGQVIEKATAAPNAHAAQTRHTHEAKPAAGEEGTDRPAEPEVSPLLVVTDGQKREREHKTLT